MANVNIVGTTAIFQIIHNDMGIDVAILRKHERELRNALLGYLISDNGKVFPEVKEKITRIISENENEMESL